MKLAALTLCLLLVACGEDGPEVAPALELGTGEWQFETMAAAQRVQLVAGTQGGFHVWLSMRAQGFAGERLRMQLQLRSARAPVASSDLSLAFEPNEEGALEFVGWPAQLLDPWCAVDVPLTVEVTLSDAARHSASATVEIVPTAPLNGFPQACSS
jgi:hypothetical protein